MSKKTEAGDALRREVLNTGLAMSTQGLSPGRSGNVSARYGKGLLITPSGMPYQELQPTDIVYVPPSGKPAVGQLKPSSEWRFHRAIYRARDDVHAIVHSHSLNATALACAEMSIPAFHYMVAVAGGNDIPLAPYATFGTDELAKAAVAALSKRNACLLSHHGQIAVGGSLEAALDLALEVETLAAQYIRVVALGAVRLLDDGEMARSPEEIRQLWTGGIEPFEGWAGDRQNLMRRQELYKSLFGRIFATPSGSAWLENALARRGNDDLAGRAEVFQIGNSFTKFHRLGTYHCRDTVLLTQPERRWAPNAPQGER